jgi:hypothetical protein
MTKEVEELTDFEKNVESMGTFATLIREYYKALLESGFDNKEALMLTVEYQKSMLVSIMRGNLQ